LKVFPKDHALRLARASQSLEGLSCGDAFGERFFLPEPSLGSLLRERTIPAPPWFFTDDTMMAVAIVDTLQACGGIDQDHLASNFGRNYHPSRGYGLAMHGLLPKLRREPACWRHESAALFGGSGSFGNGSAMRVAPLGAYFADDLETLIGQAKRSAVVTHSHSEAVAGAVAIAVAAALATTEGTATPPRDFLNQVMVRIPTSAVRHGILRAIELGSEATVHQAVRILGNGTKISAPDTVPFCLWAASRHLSDFEEAMWTTVSALGDRDTTCAIVGGIVALSAGIQSIPKAWLECREPLPLCHPKA